MAKTGLVRFKAKASGREIQITVRELTDQLNDKILDALARRGVHLPQNASLKEHKELAKETVVQLAESVAVVEPDGRTREATKMERFGVLAYDHVGTAIVKKGQELRREEEADLEEISGNSEAPSESSLT